MFRNLVILASLLLPVPSGFARDVYLIQGFSYGAAVWSTDAIFYNSGSADRTVAVVGLSNGLDVERMPQRIFSVAPHKTTSLQQSLRIPSVPLVMVHLDVPADVIVENTLYLGFAPDVLISPKINYRQFGKVRLPMYESFTPAHQPQVHLETDVGDIPAHINVGIYNPGPESATAHIETHGHCDDGTISSEDVIVPPNTVIQAGPFQAQSFFCSGFGNGYERDRSVYTVVTVDQPSLTFVSALANSGSPTTSIAVAGE
jgi:hypothetical protein